VGDADHGRGAAGEDAGGREERSIHGRILLREEPMRLILALCAVASLQASDKITTSKGDLEILPIEHATFVMKWDKATIFVDPVGGAEKFKDQGKPDLI